MLACWVALFVLLASTAQAQERLPVALLAAAGSVDIASTMAIAHHNDRYAPGSATEHNPLIAWMEPKIGTGPMLTIAAAAEAGAFWLACQRLCRTHPKLMKAALLIGAAAHGGAAAGNVVSIRTARR